MRRPNRKSKFVRHEIKIAQNLWGKFSTAALCQLEELLQSKHFSVASGDVIFLDNHWYVTHKGLLRLANRKRCIGIDVRPVRAFCDPVASKWTFSATVYKSVQCRGFVGYADADPLNVSELVKGAELRIAETRAVNRALRKAYGVGICSLEELGSPAERAHSQNPTGRIPPQPVNGNYGGGLKVRDRLCQIIRQHNLDPALVKAYATEFCGAKALREATREQVEKFVSHLADRAAQDRDALLCQLNSYLPVKGRAA